MPEEEDSREFHSLLYSKGAVAVVALLVLAMILFTLWE